MSTETPNKSSPKNSSQEETSAASPVEEKKVPKTPNKEKSKEAAKRYYESHKDQVKERINSYKSNDPDGSKAYAQKLYSARYHYKKNPSVSKAISLYAAEHKIKAEDITLSVSEVVQSVNESLGL